MDRNHDGIVNGTEAFAYQTNRRAVNAPKEVGDSADGKGLDLAGEFIRLTKLAKGKRLKIDPVARPAKIGRIFACQTNDEKQDGGQNHNPPSYARM